MTIRRSNLPIHSRFQISDFRMLRLLATAGLALLGFSVVGGCTSETPPPPRDIGQLVKPEDRLIHAIETSDVNGVRTALATGCDPNSAGSGDMPPLHLAASRGFVEAGKLLLDGRADIDLMNVSNDSASTEKNADKNTAAKNGTDKGAENNAGNNPKRRGNTALHTAVMVGNADFVRMLIEHKADLNIRNARDMTPLDLAISQEGALKIAEEQAKDPDRIALVSEQSTKNQAVLAVLREHGARTTQDLEGKRLEDIKSGGILGRLPEQIKSRPESAPPRPLEKKLPIEKPPPLEESPPPDSK
jgi:uncharacterized protein